MYINKEILEKVKAQIREEPKRVHMTPIILIGEESIKNTAGFEPPACQTVACIAGWTTLLNKTEEERANLKALVAEEEVQIKTDSYFCRQAIYAAVREARDIIGVSSRLSDRLFETDFWPSEIAEKLDMTEPGTAAYAEVVCERIDQFIENVQNSEDDEEFFDRDGAY